MSVPANVYDDFTIDPESIFPFKNLNDAEFLCLVGNVDLSDNVFNLNHLLLERDAWYHAHDDDGIIHSADIIHYDKNSKYISLDEISQIQMACDSLSLLQINCRSLKKISTTYKDW